jgi:hypothetical protein
MIESYEDFKKYYNAAGLRVRLVKLLDLTVGENRELTLILLAVWEASRRYEKRRKEAKQ